jgi:DNA-binding LytR/AlgR family response regulator
VELDLLPPDEARRMLSHRLGRDRVASEPASVDEIIKACAGLPLALAVAASNAVANSRRPLSALAGELRRRAPAGDRLQWIRASVGQMIKLIPVDEVLYFRSDEKYTLVVWVGGEALIRKSIRELLDGLEPETFIQIHRSTIVNLRFVAQVVKGPNETAEVHLKGRSETLGVSRNHVHWFRQY